ncbi:3',5'-cyclic-AMP phosphodiesterase [Anabaena azotica]|uniref:3',5'-cyclic-AMP phosphodiesterase n=1 Tax=Anabaena azotica FACHB-119 TaxID=947527 RepID=A0ABR8D7R1_9NOST|nr:3',5'-cyclic-AMP phosphodiesterase [Anabaena azotica]MBD2501788.1 3',5'-cyclic-AMP phosphodiesterase [Anabaena azotica FACHB-119]
MNEKPPISIAQVTDTHLLASENQRLQGILTTESFLTVTKRLEELRPELDLLLMTGDLSGDATAQSYENLQHYLNSLQIATYWLPGNHDCAIAMDKILNLGMVSRRKSFQRGNWHFILLNSGVADSVHGYLSPTILDWLDSELQISANNPTLIALHHAPVSVNSTWLDASCLQNSPEFFAIVERHPQVKLVLFGHIHQEFHQQRHGIHYLGSPSTCYQFQPGSPTYVVSDDLPGFRVLKLYSDGTWETKIERVPYPLPIESVVTASY